MVEMIQRPYFGSTEFDDYVADLPETVRMNISRLAEAKADCAAVELELRKASLEMALDLAKTMATVGTYVPHEDVVMSAQAFYGFFRGLHRAGEDVEYHKSIS